MLFQSKFASFSILLLSLALTACGGGFGASDSSSTTPATPEPTYYGTPTVITNGLTVTAHPEFYVRPLLSTGLSNTPARKAAIYFAEFHIYDSSGTRIQQGETTTNGLAVFDIPKTAGTYTLKVFSRSNNDHIKVSVLEDVYANTPYSISKSFTISASDITAGTKDIGTVVAEADEAVSSKIEGGAFNIHFNILLANEYIRREIGKNGTPGDGATWWVASKVTIFWKQGFNPYSYFGSSTLASFYVPNEKSLYLLGGNKGNVRTADTDHFDNSIILHEYGHFLEDNYGQSQSPGGSHNGNFIIDPRLAWSEGWANYFQSAVLTDWDDNNSSTGNGLPSNPHYKYYVDTLGYGAEAGNTSAGLLIAINMTSPGQGSSTTDRATASAEGHYREMAIARSLYKSTRKTSVTWNKNDTVSTNSGANISFNNIWSVFRGLTSAVIPNYGEFNSRLSSIVTSNTNWDNILIEEGHVKSTAKYASEPTKTCSITSYRTLNGVVENSSKSDLFRNNDFFVYYYTGNNESLSLVYKETAAPSGGTMGMDMDLIVYYRGYVYQEDYYYFAGQSSSSIAKQQRRAIASESSCETGYRCETISFSGLPTGYYVINPKINGWIASGTRARTTAEINGTVQYGLKLGGGTYLCIN